jgi:hypothetical protein
MLLLPAVAVQAPDSLLIRRPWGRLCLVSRLYCPLLDADVGRMYPYIHVRAYNRLFGTPEYGKKISYRLGLELGHADVFFLSSFLTIITYNQRDDRLPSVASLVAFRLTAELRC